MQQVQQLSPAAAVLKQHKLQTQTRLIDINEFSSGQHPAHTSHNVPKHMQQHTTNASTSHNSRSKKTCFVPLRTITTKHTNENNAGDRLLGYVQSLPHVPHEQPLGSVAGVVHEEVVL